MASPDNGGDNQTVASGFLKALNRHGYGFQYSVLRLAEDLFHKQLSPWDYVAPEFPVEVQHNGTRIDFILRHKSGFLHLLAECKRVNPALSNWCFAKSPYPPGIARAFNPFVETVIIENGARTCIRELEPTDNIFHLALEVRGPNKGDPCGQGRGAIEEAATQVCRELNGFIEFTTKFPKAFRDPRGVCFMPVIFTTARLWTSNVDLGAANLEQGTFDLSDLKVEEKPWLFYHYHQSPGLKHSISPTSQHTDIGEILYDEYVRTIAIVSPSGIPNFLGSNIWDEW